MSNSGEGAPTGCWKCGEKGHWARDCKNTPLPNSHTGGPSFNKTTKFTLPRTSFNNTSNPPSSNLDPAAGQTPEKQKPKKVTRTRPKLTPAILASNDGIGYVLRHFPNNFKFRDRGSKVVEDLENLIGLYSQWHTHLLPYFSFEQFIQKVEQVGASRHVRTRMRDLRDQIERGDDPSKMFDPPVDPNNPSIEPVGVKRPPYQSVLDELTAAEEVDHGFDMDDMDLQGEAQPPESDEELFSDFEMGNAIEEESGPVPPSVNQVPASGTSNSTEIQLTEEQKARMEANRLKALEKAAARKSVDGSLNQVPASETSSSNEIQLSEEQKARMEANRLKALERAAARASVRPSQAV